MDQGAENYGRYLRGDNAGLEWLVREYRPGLILYINGIVGDMYTAEDLCEDTFFRLMVKKPRFDGKSSFKTWLYQAARNLACDKLRNDNRLRRVSLESAEQEADKASLEDMIIKDERQKVMLSQLQKLSDGERELIWLTYYEGLSAKETARLTGKTVTGVNKALSRAREKLRYLMEKEGYGNENE